MTVAYREYTAYLRFTIGATTYAWASRAGTRNSVVYLGILSRWPAPTDSMQDSFGIVEADRFNIEVSDPSGTYLSLTSTLAGVEATLELVTRRVLTAGSPTETVNTRKVTVESVTRLPGALSLELADLDRLRLEAEYPFRRFTVADFPSLYVDDVGKPVPVVVGTALKVPFVSTNDNGGNGPWVYAGPQKLGTETVLTVYSDGRIVDPAEYAVSSTTVGGLTYITLSFTREQVDFQGSVLPITADISGSVSRDAGAELHRVMTASGLTPEFAAGSVFNTTNKMLVDTAYVQPRTFQAIIEDLLLVLRGHLYRTSTGGWQLVQDRDNESSFILNESAGDLVEISGYTKPRRAQTVELEYYQNNAAELLNLKHVISKSGGGASGKIRYVAPYLRDHEGADRLLDYLAKREQNMATAAAVIHDVQIMLGEVITLANPLLWSGNKSFICQRITRAEDRNEVELREYVASVYTYTPGTLPADATRGYSPDYSLTFPDPPTNLTVVSTQAAQNADGSTSAWVKLSAKLPATNANRMGFSVSNNTTGELHTGPAEITLGDPTVFQVVIPGLRPGQAYTALAWAISPFGLEGEAVTTGFTAGAWTATPAVPATISVTQGTGKSIRIVWSGVTTANLRHYVLQRNSITVYTGNSTGYVDQDSTLAYDATYTYRVQAVDRFGNVSAWVTAIPFILTRNIGGSDLPSGAIVRDHLADLLITAEKIASGAIDLGGNKVLGLLKEANMPVITDPTKIADNLIGNTKLINAAITASKIADGQIDLGGTKVAGLLSNARLAPITDSTKIADALIGKSHLVGAVGNLLDLQIAAGINVGAVGNVRFVKNTGPTGAVAAGDIRILPGRLFLPDGTELSFTGDNALNTRYELAVVRAPFYLVAGATNASTRFGTGFQTHKIFHAWYDAQNRQWIALGQNDQSVVFTPAANDTIVAVGAKHSNTAGNGIDELSSLLTPFLLSSTNIDNFVSNQAIGTAQIGNAAIGSAQIAAAAIETAHIQTAAITNALIANAAVGSAQIANAAITEAKIGTAAIGTAAIKDGAITNALIANAAIGSAQIAAAAIDTVHVKDAAIGNAAIANLAVTNEKVGGILQSSQVMSGRPRWKIDKNGAAEFTGVTIYDTDGNLVFTSGGSVGSVDWNAITGRPSNEQLQNQLLDPSTWSIGSSGDQSGFNAVGNNNSIINAAGPHIYALPTWRCIGANQDANGANGGFVTSAFAVNPAKPYRFSIWMNKAAQLVDGTSYFGCLADTVRKRSTGVIDANPYFWTGVLPVVNKWYLLVGYIFPANATTSTTIDGGIYDGATGLKVADAAEDFVFKDFNQTTNVLRSFLYFSTNTATRLWLLRPRVDVLDGNEVPVESLISGAGILNNNISIDANGNLIGAGGGQVTASGIGAVRTDLINAPAGILNGNVQITADGTLIGAGGGQVNLAGLGAGGFAYLNQITEGNISTYIKTAAIGGAYIGAAAIGTAHIADGQITNAKIGGIIQSTEIMAGRPRWKINKDGAAEFTGVSIYDTEGNLIFASGGSVSSVDWESITNRPPDDQLKNQLLDPSTWVLGSTGSQPGFNAINNTSNYNSIIESSGPQGIAASVWRCIGGTQDAQGGNAGFVTSSFTVNPNKKYRFSVWMYKSVSLADGTAFFGCLGDTVRKRSNGTVDSNPYFWSGDPPALNKWYLFVGYIFPASATTSVTVAGGIYDGATGLKVADAAEDFVWKDLNQTSCVLRSFLYFSTDAATRLWLLNPRVDVADGNEPPVEALIAGSGILNNNISISSSGTLVGAGGGQVTLPGLGAGPFATLSQITSGNISTYIASAAIGGAYIGAAAIGTAHIGVAQIDTLRIAGNAVTIPASAYTDSAISIPTTGTWTAIQSITISGTGAPVFVLFSGIFGSAGVIAGINLRMLKNGALLVNMGNVVSASTDEIRALSYRDSGFSGTLTYTVQVQAGAGNPSVSKRSLLALEAKR